MQTESGARPIEEIKAGDRVLSWNAETKQTEYKAVTAVFTRQAETILDVRIANAESGETLGVTPEHPFYVRVHRARDNLSGDEDEDAGEWRNASDLRAGDKVRRPSGEWVAVLEIKQRGGGARVYNFEVEGNHNYYVGDVGVLVHNCGQPMPKGLFEFTNDVSLNQVKRIAKNGINEPVDFIEYGGKNYIVDGNHRLAAAFKAGLSEIPARKACLPHNGFNSIDDVLDAATPALRERIMRKLSY